MAQQLVIADYSRRTRGRVGVVSARSSLVSARRAGSRARPPPSSAVRRVAAPPALSAALVCQERVTYRQGTDDHTVSQEVYRRPLPVTADHVAGQVSGHLSIEVPVDRPPSLNLHHNAINWTVEVQVRVPGVPDDKGTFRVTVLSVVAARLLGDAGGPGCGHAAVGDRNG